jgi:hypothetical protein
MLSLLRNPITLAGILAFASALGACTGSQFVDFGSAGTNLLPRVDKLARPDWLTYSGGKEEFTLRPITAADLVSPEGQCAMAAPQAAPPPGPDPGSDPVGAPTVPGGIALQMTECDVVLRAGAPDQVQIGGDERGQRAVVITYIRGSRPGIYRFAGGRLQSVERAPGPPPAAKQKAKAKKKKST